MKKIILLYVCICYADLAHLLNIQVCLYFTLLHCRQVACRLKSIFFSFPAEKAW